MADDAPSGVAAEPVASAAATKAAAMAALRSLGASADPSGAALLFKIRGRRARQRPRAGPPPPAAPRGAGGASGGGRRGTQTPAAGKIKYHADHRTQRPPPPPLFTPQEGAATTPTREKDGQSTVANSSSCTTTLLTEGRSIRHPRSAAPAASKRARRQTRRHRHCAVLDGRSILPSHPCTPQLLPTI